MACPVSDCANRPVSNCEFCPVHHRFVNNPYLWLIGRVPNDFGSTFDSDRFVWEDEYRLRAGAG
jgi:hypothetical protein